MADVRKHITFYGRVQGVGFRPYVAKAADKLGMKGQVLNIGGLVEITVTDTPARISAFIEYILTNKPAPAEIVHISVNVAEGHGSHERQVHIVNQNIIQSRVTGCTAFFYF